MHQQWTKQIPLTSLRHQGETETAEANQDRNTKSLPAICHFLDPLASGMWLLEEL